ncbi:hypothetical protein EV193_101430 [Herbihabitans rhizosphaerae]|uniref:DUF3093 family protein n=1 Tax=Herbihabitans rhizosphaerae TaxID=1872711 RepID=A0A4Q7L5K3_9PSEU|nr:hypothetical protein [Herbihabitans rhizosphaerae]RZS44554.1 hypothetical protein EV193_101430 [Herbihabitans rhizosphaerae]
MTEPDDSGPVLYAEDGSSWWPVLWGPVFAAACMAIEAATGATYWLPWTLVGLALAGMAAVWVRARRMVCRVRLTPTTFTQGRENLAVAQIRAVTDVGTPVGARVLGGGWAVPKKFDDVPLKLDDDSVVVAWARDGKALRDAIGTLVEPR